MNRTVILSLFLVIGCAKPFGTRANAADSPPSYVIKFPNNGLSAKIEFKEKPVTKKSTSFTIKFWETDKGTEKSGPYVNPKDYDLTRTPKDADQELPVHLWMPSMGHGSTKQIKVEKLEGKKGDAIEGVYYNCTNVYFTMNGKWEIKVQFLNKDDDAKVDEEAKAEHTQN